MNVKGTLLGLYAKSNTCTSYWQVVQIKLQDVLKWKHHKQIFHSVRYQPCVQIHVIPKAHLYIGLHVHTPYHTVENRESMFNNCEWMHIFEHVDGYKPFFPINSSTCYQLDCGYRILFMGNPKGSNDRYRWIVLIVWPLH